MMGFSIKLLELLIIGAISKRAIDVTAAKRKTPRNLFVLTEYSFFFSL